MSFRVIKEIPPHLVQQIQDSVFAFMAESHLPEGTDRKGFYYQTLESIANATHLGGGGDFWIEEIDGEVAIYLLGHVSKDIDNRLTYWVTQCYVNKKHRGKKIVKEWWQLVRQRAKDLLCSHMVVVSSRGADAYCRFLGPGWKPYANLLKETF